MKTVVLTSFDENYYPYAHVTVRSFSDNYFGDTPQDFYCLVPPHVLDLEEEFIKKVGNPKNLKIKFVCAPGYEELEKRHDEIKVVGEGHFWLNRHALHRIFMIEVLDGFDKAIYIDPDTLVLRNVNPILKYPMYNKFISCLEVHDEINHLTSSKDDIYFSDGVFITDLNFWRTSGIHYKMKKYIYENEIPPFLDQDVFNIFFMPYYSPMPLRFNTYPIYLDSPFLSDHTSDPLIVHFVGWEKPWKDIKSNKYVEMWINLRDRLEA